MELTPEQIEEFGIEEEVNLLHLQEAFQTPPGAKVLKAEWYATSKIVNPQKLKISATTRYEDLINLATDRFMELTFHFCEKFGVDEKDDQSLSKVHLIEEAFRAKGYEGETIIHMFTNLLQKAELLENEQEVQYSPQTE